MKENEAIKELETSIDLAKMCTQNYERKSEIQGYEMAIKALEEVQQYRQIGTVEECREAVEKQTAKKPIRHTAWENFKCPACGSAEIVQYDTEYREYDKDCKFEYCSDCGQKLDWSDEE